MTLTKKKMVREIGRRTRLTNREVQEVIEALVDVWTETLVAGEKIEIQNFLVLEIQEIDRGKNRGFLMRATIPPQYIKRVNVRASKYLKKLLRCSK